MLSLNTRDWKSTANVLPYVRATAEGKLQTLGYASAFSFAVYTFLRITYYKDNLVLKELITFLAKQKTSIQRLMWVFIQLFTIKFFETLSFSDRLDGCAKLPKSFYKEVMSLTANLPQGIM